MKTDFLKPLATAKFWKELVIMTLGMLVGAAAVYYFLMPSKLIIGSISGFSIVLSEIFAKFGMTVRVSVIIAAINAVLLVLAWLLIGAEFGAKTVYTALILGPLVDFWAWVLPFEKLVTDGTSIMNDPWLDLICFVLMLSISQAILFRINASTGGLDILAKIVNKYLHFDIGTSVTIAGALICCSAFAINPFRMVVIGLIGTWINGIAVDYFTDTLNKEFHHQGPGTRLQPLQVRGRFLRGRKGRGRRPADPERIRGAVQLPEKQRLRGLHHRRQRLRNLRQLAQEGESSG